MKKMRVAGKRVFVTGGAGFIGSHIVDAALREGAENVSVYDNLSTGQRSFLTQHFDDPRFSLIVGDIQDSKLLRESMKDHEIVFHLQANADVRGGIADTSIDLNQNVIGTWNVLESVRLHGIKTILFSSSAVVYGEPEVFPTPESNELIQTSVYGASKLAGEAYIQAYATYFGIRSVVFRFVSWIGERYTHGVIFDFMKKLKSNPHKLDILGNGTQKKSYLYVGDGVDAIFCALEKSPSQIGVFNLGHDAYLDVKTLAGVVIDEMGLKNVELVFGTGDRGWVGDSPFVHLDTTKIKSLGWATQTSIEDGIRKTVRYLLTQPHLLSRK